MLHSYVFFRVIYTLNTFS